MVCVYFGTNGLHMLFKSYEDTGLANLELLSLRGLVPGWWVRKDVRLHLRILELLPLRTN